VTRPRPQRCLDVACDVGGGFVDLCATGSGAILTAKVPRRRAATLTDMLHAALAAAGIAPAEVGRLRLSTTLAANALLAGEAAPVALVATAGFTDVPDLGRQSRRDPDLWPPPPPTPPWMSPEAWRFPLRGRIAADGSQAEKLALDELDALRALPHGTPVALCLLFAHRNPAHELTAASRIAALRPDLPISLSHRVDPQPREFERMLATLADASLKPLVLRLLAAEGLPAPWVMRAEGGLVPLAEALERPLGLVGSGPAAGALAVAHAALGDDAIGLDIGSATTEVSVHRAGAPLPARGTWLDEMWLRGTSLDVESLRLGGAMLLTTVGERLRLGPGIAPDGPACLGGTAATLTDAALCAGLAAEAGTSQREAARRACKGIDPAAVLRLAVAWLAERVRRIAFRRNLDLARARLVVGGGAGVFLAQAIAAELGARELVVPCHAAVLAATGLARAPAMAWEEMACDLGVDTLGTLHGHATQHAVSLRARLQQWGVPAPRLRHELDLAPGPRAEPLTLGWTPGDDSSLATRFAEAARAQRGQAPPGVPRVLALRSIAAADLPAP
jgi:N-methylhydantoinase A